MASSQPSLTSFDPFSVGFDKTFKLLASHLDGIGKSLPGYPPYNIKKVDDNKYVIEMAVAGFAKTDIEITMENGKLIIAGNTTPDENDVTYFYKGIAERAFTRQFTLADSVEIKDAHLMNGILKIILEQIIPDSKKPKKIEITE